MRVIFAENNESSKRMIFYCIDFRPGNACTFYRHDRRCDPHISFWGLSEKCGGNDIVLVCSGSGVFHVAMRNRRPFGYRFRLKSIRAELKDFMARVLSELGKFNRGNSASV